MCKAKKKEKELTTKETWHIYRVYIYTPICVHTQNKNCNGKTHTHTHHVTQAVVSTSIDFAPTTDGTLFRRRG